MSVSAMKQALEALEEIQKYDRTSEWFDKKVTALRQALAEADKQEPVAWHEPGSYGNVTRYKDWALANGWLPLYTAPPKREWVGLTDEEIQVVVNKVASGEYQYSDTFARAIEAKLKEKNA